MSRTRYPDYRITVRSKEGTHERTYVLRDQMDKHNAMNRAGHDWETETGRDDSFVSGCEELS